MYNRTKPIEPDGGGSGYAVPGPRGVSGYSGMSGIEGAFSASGYSGMSGISGFSGRSGYTGISGYSGIGHSGYSGASSYSGFSGFSSYSGRSGYSGISGFSGTSGISGRSGYSGYSGILGTSGYSGYSGLSGRSGYSGIIGISGYSGSSGLNGSSIIMEYFARNVSGSEVFVSATNTGITASMDGNTITFSVPQNVRLVSASIRCTGDSSLVINTGRVVTGWADRFQPNVQAWREDLGSMIPITVTMSPTGPYNIFQVNNLVPAATNYIKLAF